MNRHRLDKHSLEHWNPKVAWSKWSPSREQPWNRAMAAHLFRRIGFGASAEQLEKAESSGVDAAIQQAFNTSACKGFDTELEPMERALSSAQEPMQLASWWLLRMIKTPCQALEKATLFWHGHFATSAEKVQNSRAMLHQNRLLRENALGRFEPMVQGISRDVAMLIYLDSTDNRKIRPNENYARELMELFCLGPGNYTEDDIKQIARCFTGWEIRRETFRFNKNQHDFGSKSFLGETGEYGGEDAVRIVLGQEACPRFLAKKLIRFYVMDDVEITDEFSEPVASHLRVTDFDLGSTIKLIASSNVFFSADAVGKKIRSPVEMAIGLLRGLNGTTSASELARRLRDIGQLPMFPPNVKGWDGGRQWINASTYLGRANLVRDLVTGDTSDFSSDSVGAEIGIPKLSAEEMVDRLLETFVAVPLPDEARQALTKIAQSANKNNRDRVASDLFTYLAALPEFQLG